MPSTPTPCISDSLPAIPTTISQPANLEQIPRSSVDATPLGLLQVIVHLTATIPLDTPSSSHVAEVNCLVETQDISFMQTHAERFELCQQQPHQSSVLVAVDFALTPVATDVTSGPIPLTASELTTPISQPLQLNPEYNRTVTTTKRKNPGNLIHTVFKTLHETL